MTNEEAKLHIDWLKKPDQFGNRNTINDMIVKLWEDLQAATRRIEALESRDPIARVQATNQNMWP